MHFEPNIEIKVVHKQSNEGLYYTNLDLPSPCIFISGSLERDFVKRPGL